MRRLALLVLIGSFVLAQTASADPPEVKHGPLGVVPAHNQASKRGGGSNLTYHGGPTMPTNKVYAIYWVPSGYSVSSGYQSTIDQYFGDVAHDSGLQSNVYYSDTQYYDNLSRIAYSSTVGASYVDTNAFPASGCSDSVAATTACLSDTQLRNEIDRVMHVNGWQANPTTMFFMFTPKNVGSCDSQSSCAFSYYCAYHWDFVNSDGVDTIYANQPYTNTSPSSCGTGQGPNDADADSTLNVVSHEHNEAITDPLGTAWFDSRGYENGDKCAWTFGTASGTSGQLYNQTINGRHYYLQREWSNAHPGCVLTGV